MKGRLSSLFIRKSAKEEFPEAPPKSPYFPYKVPIPDEQQTDYPRLTEQIKTFESCDEENKRLRSKFLTTKTGVEPNGYVYWDALASEKERNGQSAWEVFKLLYGVDPETVVTYSKEAPSGDHSYCFYFILTVQATIKARNLPVSEDIEAAFTNFLRAVDEHLKQRPIPQLSIKQDNAVGKAYWAYLKLMPAILWNKLYAF